MVMRYDDARSSHVPTETRPYIFPFCNRLPLNPASQVSITQEAAILPLGVAEDVLHQVARMAIRRCVLVLIHVCIQLLTFTVIIKLQKIYHCFKHTIHTFPYSTHLTPDVGAYNLMFTRKVQRLA